MQMTIAAGCDSALRRPAARRIATSEKRMTVPDSANIRQERIEKLLHELRYEIERGMLEHESDETLTFRFGGNQRS
jgi:hypothetical protein